MTKIFKSAAGACAFVLASTVMLHAAQADEQTQSLAAENFMQADENGDAILTPAEFRTLINLNAEDGIGRASLVVRMNRYDTAFGRVDTNGDGLVTPDELQAMAANAQ